MLSINDMNVSMKCLLTFRLFTTPFEASERLGKELDPRQVDQSRIGAS